MVYNLRSHGALPTEGAPEEEDVQAEIDEGDEWEDEDDDDDNDDDTVENDPFYQPYLQNENLMSLGRILRYELDRMEHLLLTDLGEDEDEEEDPPVENTRVVPESEVSLPQTEALVVETPPVPPTTSLSDPDKLSLADFEGLPRYRLAFMCVRYFEWTGIRNIATASSISNDALMRALCQIPRGRVVPDCAICSYPLWDALETKCCSQPLCIHCVNRCAECPYCRSAEY